MHGRGSSSTASAARHTEQQLEARVRRTSQLLQEETQKLQSSLQSHDNQKLALAVEQGVDDYYDDLRTMRRERRAVAGVGGDPGTMVRRLREEERRLDDGDWQAGTPARPDKRAVAGGNHQVDSNQKNHTRS